MPDAATLERLVGALKASDADSVIDTLESPGRVAIEVKPESIVGSLEVIRTCPQLRRAGLAPTTRSARPTTCLA